MQIIADAVFFCSFMGSIAYSWKVDLKFTVD